MEITFENRLKRTERLVRPDGTGRDASAGEAAVSAAAPRTDRMSSSRQAVRQAVEQMDRQSQRLAALLRQDQPTEKKTYIWDMLDGEEETGSSEADALGEQMKTMDRCHKIAARIMRGDKVPPEDERYLMLNDPDGYKLALAMRTPRRNPKKWESVLKEEEKDARSRQAAEADGEAASSRGEAGEASGEGGASSEGE